MSPTLEAYMSGIIDRNEYIRRRYAEETDALVVNLRHRPRADGSGHAAGDVGRDLTRGQSDADR